MAQADLIICGHSHRPFVRQVGDVWFINTGSVGRPDDGDPRATYAVLCITSGEIEVEHIRVAYDVESSAAAIRENHLPEAFAQMLIRGTSLDDWMALEESSSLGSTTKDVYQCSDKHQIGKSGL